MVGVDHVTGLATRELEGLESQAVGGSEVAASDFIDGVARRVVKGRSVGAGDGASVLQVALGFGGRVRSVRVDMGTPSFDARTLPTALDLDRIVNHSVDFDGADYVLTCVSMGNPHAVIFVDNLDSISVEEVGPRIERASIFPERINAHFVQVASPTHIVMRTWERGAGATRACGTGACAVCVAGVITERASRSITATLPAGDLHIAWNRDDDHVTMTGPATEVFTGEWKA